MPANQTDNRSRPTIYFARHAPVVEEYEHRCFGRLDVAASLPAEEATAEILAGLDAHAGHDVGAVHSSGTSRCAGPAARVAAGLCVPHVVDPRLAGLDHGDFEGRTWEEIQEESSKELADWGLNWLNQGPPGGEAALQIQARVESWYDSLPKDARVLVVGDVGPWRALRIIRSLRIDWQESISARLDHLDVVRVD